MRLDMYELCTAQLQEQLVPSRKCFKEVEERKAVCEPAQPVMDQPVSYWLRDILVENYISGTLDVLLAWNSTVISLCVGTQGAGYSRGEGDRSKTAASSTTGGC